MKAAHREGRLRGKAKEKLEKGQECLRLFIKRKMYQPAYSSLVQLPVGVGE